MAEFLGNDKFDREEMKPLIKGAIQQSIGRGRITDEKLRLWSVKIGEEVIERLALLKKPMKYLVFTDLQDNCKSGFHFVTSAIWDENKDNFVSVEYENQYVWACVTVIGVSL